MATIKLFVEAEVNFVSGKFAPRDEIVQALIDDGCNDPGSISPGEGEYEVAAWDVFEYVEPITAAMRKRIARLAALEKAVGIAIDDPFVSKLPKPIVAAYR